MDFLIGAVKVILKIIIMIVVIILANAAIGFGGYFLIALFSKKLALLWALAYIILGPIVTYALVCGGSERSGRKITIFID